MKYIVVGVRRETNEEVSMEVDAPTPQAAELQATELGVLVSRVEPVVRPAAPAPAPAVELDPESPAALVAEVRALRHDVRMTTRAALRFTQTPVRTIALGVLCGNLLTWAIGLAVWLPVFLLSRCSG